MIEVEHLTKDYGTVVAVRDVSFRVGSGEVVGFLGPNGAGKSTTLRILAGFLGATSGKVSIAGHDIVEQSLAARRCLGYMPEASPLYPEMKVEEYLRFRAALKGVSRKGITSAVARALERANINDVRETLISHLSKGYRQRVGLADALVSDPKLLILDEPTAGLDPNQIRDVRKLIRELGKEHTVLISTHILSEVQASCDRAIVIDRGIVVAEGTIAELSNKSTSSSLTLELRDPDAKALGLLKELPGVGDARALPSEGEEDTTRLEVSLSTEPSTRAELSEQIVRALVLANIGVRSVSRTQASLEQVFAELTRSEREHRSRTPEA